MEIASLVLSAISTLAAVVSAIAAIGAKNEVKKLKTVLMATETPKFLVTCQSATVEIIEALFRG